MDLKFRRNLPLLLLFLTVIAVLVLGLGNQPIIAYTIEDSGQPAGVSTATEDTLIDGIEPLSGLAAASNGVSNAPDTDPATTLEN